MNTKMQENLRKLDEYFACESPSREWLSLKGNHELDREDINAAYELSIPQGELDQLNRKHLKKHCPNIEVLDFNDPLVARYARKDNLWVRKLRMELQSGIRKKMRHQPERQTCDGMSVPQYLDPPSDPTPDQITVNTNRMGLAFTKTQLIPVNKRNSQRQSMSARTGFARKLREEKKTIVDQANEKIHRLWETNEQEKQAMRNKSEQDMKVIEKEKTTLIQKLKVMQKEKTTLMQEMEVMREEKIAVMQKMKVVQKEKLAVIREMKVMQEEQIAVMQEMKVMQEEIRALKQERKGHMKRNSALMEQVTASRGLTMRRRSVDSLQTMREKISELQSDAVKLKQHSSGVITQLKTRVSCLELEVLGFRRRENENAVNMLIENSLLGSNEELRSPILIDMQSPVTTSVSKVGFVSFFLMTSLKTHFPRVKVPTAHHRRIV